MIGKGVFKRQVDGKEVGFKFGMYASGISEQEAGCSIYEIFKNISEGKKVTQSLLVYFYGGYVAYNKKNNLEGVSMVDFSDVLESIGLDDMLTIYNDSLKSPDLKNVPAPEAGQNSQ